MTTKLKEKTTELKGKVTGFMDGELALKKLDFLLLSVICLLAGICIGLLAAPLTHGVTIASNNGNNNVSTKLNKTEEMDEDQEQDQK